jgi:ubiquinol-cytochrome c reductase cytochrome b subunit
MRVGHERLRGVLGRLMLVCAVACFVLAIGEIVSAPVAHASSKAMRQQGAALFHEKGCEHCHGVDGVGTERGPNLSGVGRALHKPQIELQIRDGGKEMPAFGKALSDDEVTRLVAFLAAKKKKGVRPAPMSAPVLPVVATPSA